MSNRRKYLAIALIFLVCGLLIGDKYGYSDPPSPTVDEFLGIFDFLWGNFTQGVNTQEYYRNGQNFTAWIESISEGGVTDHGELNGLDDDDHSLYLLQDGSEGLTGDWDVGEYDITAKDITADEFYRTGLGNYTAWIESISGMSETVTHIVSSASELESVIEGLPNSGTYYIICNWHGSSTASIVLPSGASGLDITIKGLGQFETTLIGRTDEATIDSTLTEWAALPNFFRFEDITINADSDFTLNALFWHTQVDNVDFYINANANSKGIIIGGSGADAWQSTWTDWGLIHESGVTTNSAMRIWLESFVSINADILLKGDIDIGYVFELMGTSSTFLKTNLHQWQGRDITGAMFYINGHGHFSNIYGLYGAESGGTASVINSLVRIGSGYNSTFSLDGAIHMTEDDTITEIYYDDWTASHTAMKSHIAGGLYGNPYEYTPLPPAITVPLFYRVTSSTSNASVPSAYATWPNYNNFTLDLTGYTKATLFGRVTASTSNPASVACYDWTNTQEIVSFTWSGNSVTMFYNATTIQTITGDVKFGIAIKSVGSQTIYLHQLVVVFW